MTKDNKASEGNDVRWTIYLKDKELQSELKDLIKELKKEVQNYSQSQLAIDSMKLTLELIKLFKEYKFYTNLPEFYEKIRGLITSHVNNSDIPKIEIYQDFIQTLSPLNLFIKMMKDNLPKEEGLNKLLKNTEDALIAIKTKLDTYFKGPSTKRFITEYDILYVDDEELSRNFFSYFAEKKGFTIVTTENAELALNELKNFTPKLILIDINLPGKIQGDDLCRILRSREEYSTIPIVLITAMVIDDKDKFLKQTGANQIILKSNIDSLEDLNFIFKFLRS